MRLRESLSSALPLFRRIVEARARLETGHPGSQRPSTAKITRPNRKLTPAEVDALAIAYLAGTDLRTLGKQFRLHRQTVRAHLRRRGVALRSDSPALSEPEINKAVELYADGLSTAKIASRFGVSAGTVQRALKARGAAVRSRTDHWKQ